MLFILPQKVFSSSRYLSFCVDFLVMSQNGLAIKISLISNFMTLQPSEETVVTHIFSNIARLKGNKTLRFGQLIEYNMRNTFLKKLSTKYGGKTSPRPFYGKLKLSISLDQ